MGKNGEVIRQSATWRAMESKSVAEIGKSCNWSAEFMGAVISAPPGVASLDDIDKDFIISKFREKLPESYQAAITEAKNIRDMINAAIITLIAESKISHNYTLFNEPDMLREILFP